MGKRVVDDFDETFVMFVVEVWLFIYFMYLNTSKVVSTHIKY